MKSCASYWGLLVFQKTAAMFVLQTIPFEFELFLRATRGAHNPNLQVVITHASWLHVCSQHSFEVPLRMY